MLVDRERELIADRTPQVLEMLPGTGEGWTIHHALFARTGFIRAARAAVESAGGQLANLERLDVELRNTPTTL